MTGKTNPFTPEQILGAVCYFKAISPFKNQIYYTENFPEVVKYPYINKC